MSVHHNEADTPVVGVPPPDDTERVAVPLLGYLRTMLAGAFSAFCFPLKTTVVDLMTGEVIERY